MLGLSVIILFNLIYNVNSNLAESSANCSERAPDGDDKKDAVDSGADYKFTSQGQGPLGDGGGCLGCRQIHRSPTAAQAGSLHSRQPSQQPPDDRWDQS